MPSRRILFIANSTFPKGAANSVNALRMVGALAKQGYRVWFLARRSSLLGNKRLWVETCRRYGERFEAKTFFLWWPFKRGAEIALTTISLFFMLFLRIPVFTRVRYAALLATFLKRETIFEIHMPPQKSVQKKMDRWMLSKPQTRIFVISQKLREIYKQMGLNVDKIPVAPDAGREINHRLPQKEDFGGKSIHCGYIGSLYEGRGFEMIEELARQMPERYFHVIGNLSSLRRSNGHLSKNIYLYDEVTPHQAELMTRLFDVLLMPYQEKVKIGNGVDTSQWMSPLKMFEYLLSGKPLIASDLPVLREVLRHSENCLLAPPSDIMAWKKAIEQLDNPEFRHHLASQAWSEARSRYTWETRLQDFLSPRV